MLKYSVLTEEQREILRRNDIGTEHVAVDSCGEDYIRLLNQNTRDIITIHQGDRKW